MYSKFVSFLARVSLSCPYKTLLRYMCSLFFHYPQVDLATGTAIIPY